VSNRDQPGLTGLFEKSSGIGPLGLLPPIAAAGVGYDDFALYQALHLKKRAELGTAQNYLVSWPYNPALLDPSLAVGLTNQRLCMVPQLVAPGQAIDGVATIQHVNGVYTPNNTNGVAAYSFNGVTFTRLAQGTGGTTWSSGTGYNPVAFSGQLAAASAWRILWACCLYCESAQTTAPVLAASFQAGGGGVGADSPGLGTYSFQVDVPASTNFPATIAAGSVTSGDSNRQWLGFYRNQT
jgi:hypothetical protein